MRELAAIQRRFYALVTAGDGTLEPGLLGASRHLAVYAEMYEARLCDVLADDHPKLHAVVGGEAFRELAAAYLRARPPRSFTVRDAGRELAAYLAARSDLPPWLAELAALERARVEVFDAADAAAATRDDLAGVAADRFPALRLALVPASALVPLAWTVDDAWSAIEDDEAGSPPVPCTRCVLVWRRELDVVHRTLDADEAALAPALARGATIAELADRLAARVSAPAERMVELLARWLDAGAIAIA